MIPILVTSFGGSSTLNSTTITLAVPEPIAVGAKVIVTSAKGTVTEVSGGTLTDTQGNVWARDAASQRNSNFDLEVHSCIVTTRITGSITMTWPGASNRKALVVSVWTGVGNKLASSANVVGVAGSSNSGSNGSNTSPSATTTGSAVGLVVGSSTVSQAIGLASAGSSTLIRTARTAAGTGDRGCGQEYYLTTTGTTQTASWTLSASQGWAACTVVYHVPKAPPVVVAGVKKATASRSVVTGGMKKTVVNMWTIVGGVKKPRA